MARSSGCNRNVIGWSFLKQARFLSVRVSSFGKSETSDTWAKVPIPAQFRPIYINLLQSNKTEISIFLAWNRLPVPVILYQTQLLPPAVEPRPLRPCFEEIVQFHPRFEPLSKVYDVCISGHAMHQAVSRGRKQYLSGCSERVRYRDAIKFQ